MSDETSQEAYVKPAHELLNQNPYLIFAIEMVMGWLAFLGVGWYRTRRPAMAVLLFVLWQATFWIALWALLVLLAPETIPFVAAIYFTLPILSGIWAATSYVKQAARLKKDLVLEINPASSKRTPNKAMKS